MPQSLHAAGFPATSQPQQIVIIIVEAVILRQAKAVFTVISISTGAPTLALLRMVESIETRQQRAASSIDVPSLRNRSSMGLPYLLSPIAEKVC